MVETHICDDNYIPRYATETDDTLCMCLPLMRTYIYIQDGFMVCMCVIDFIMKSTSNPQVTASDYTVEMHHLMTIFLHMLPKQNIPYACAHV